MCKSKDELESNKVVFVAGGSSGIGRATSILYAKQGYKVAVHGVDKRDVEETVDKCNKVSPNNLKAFGVVGDFDNVDECDVTVGKVIGHYNKIDIMIFSVGVIFKSTLGDLETYKRVMSLNLDSAVKTTFAVAKYLMESKGNIVYVSSVDSLIAYKSGFSYCCSKAALSMFAKCMAIEFDGQVRVNYVCPGGVETPLFDAYGLDRAKVPKHFKDMSILERIAQPEEIANVIYFLTSNDASYVMGAGTIVDGGTLLKTPSYVYHANKRRDNC